MKNILSREGVDPQKLHLVDGSGLSFYNLVKPADLGLLLRSMSKKGKFSRYFRSLAIAGRDGTLRNRMKNHSNASWLYPVSERSFADHCRVYTELFRKAQTLQTGRGSYYRALP